MVPIDVDELPSPKQQNNTIDVDALSSPDRHTKRDDERASTRHRKSKKDKHHKKKKRKHNRESPVPQPIVFTGTEEYYVDKKCERGYISVQTLHRPACPKYVKKYKKLNL